MSPVALDDVDGRIWNPGACEVNAVLHCNLRCRSCSHLSPAFGKHVADPEVVYRDLRALADVYRCAFVKVLGGEPLLHPRLGELLRAIRESGIAPRTTICTNGIVVGHVDPSIWSLVDELEVSAYPNFELTDARTADLEMVASKGTTVVVNSVPLFQESFALEGTSDDALVHRIYRACKVAHWWRCHTVIDGYFFKCPQSVFLPKILDEDWRLSGIRIDQARRSFRDDLLRYLNDPLPLPACRRCLGTAGRVFAHEQIRRADFVSSMAHTTEELIDIALLEADERHPSGTDVCTEGAPSWTISPATVGHPG